MNRVCCCDYLSDDALTGLGVPCEFCGSEAVVLAGVGGVEICLCLVCVSTVEPIGDFDTPCSSCGGHPTFL